MKILDKLKNALFEEEYVEVDEVERPKKEKPKKESKRDLNKLKEEKRLRDVKLTNYADEEEELERPIAKKIMPEKKEEKPPVVHIEEKIPVVQNVEEPEEYKYPKVEETSFTEDSYDYSSYDNIPVEEEIKVQEVEEKKTPSLYKEPVYGEKKHEKEEAKLYKTSKEDEYIKNYTAHEYGNYAPVKEKKVFKPSPNISPIYGIIDESKITRPEPKKEVRLTSATRNEKINVDEIREKAFGTIEDDLKITINNYANDEDEVKEDMLVDLRDDSAPEVSKITMGDAEEYFQDLGLEYDTDYIDARKAKASGRRLRSEEEIDTPRLEEPAEELPSFLKEKDPIIEEHQVPNTRETIKIEEQPEENDEDNLFDLIDSMYDR